MPKNLKTLFLFNSVLVIFASFLISSSAYANGDNKIGYSILRKAEETRAPWNQMSLIANLITQKNDSQSFESYQVFFKEEVKTLVSFVEPKFEKGNLLLMVRDNLWFYVKATSRPIRITPIQRLSGSVSYGDITRLGWSKDYDIEKFQKKKLSKDITQYEFSLKARSKGATYQRINLYIDTDYRPKKAEVFLLSGKHYKTLTFSKYSQVSGKEINTEIIFIDHLNNNKVSTMNFEKINSEVKIPSRYFIKTALPDLSNAL
tara:strand:+ start:3734 stop:4513 length:780 start_codon:yes stop_codon:yes gene_type:complete